VIVGTLRAFAASVLHGSTTAIVGMAVAGFPLGRVRHPLLGWVIGLTIAISIHTIYNNTAYHNFVFGQMSYLALTSIAFAALVLATSAMLWGLRLERLRLRKSLGMKAGVSKGEAMLVQHVDDFDDLLAPLEERFGEVKREQVANALLLGAQLAMKQELKQARHDVGIYIMSYVRSIMPKTTWSLWARLEQILMKLGTPGTNLWNALEAKLAVHDSTGTGLHARIQAALDARILTAALATEGEE